MKNLVIALVLVLSASAQAKTGIETVRVTKASKLSVSISDMLIQAFVINDGQEVILAHCSGNFLHPTNRTLSLQLPNGKRASVLTKNQQACKRILAAMNEATSENPVELTFDIVAEKVLSVSKK